MGIRTTFNSMGGFQKIADNVAKVKCKGAVTWFLTKDGDLYGCGYNGNGNQGSGDTTNTATFTKRASNVIDFDCSNYNTYYINKNNELYYTGSLYGGSVGGRNTFGKIYDDVIKVVTSNNTVWIIFENGDLYGVGKNTYGQQGSGNTTEVTTFTKRVTGGVSDVKTGTNGDTTWYIINDDTLCGCGRNNYGQQGSGNTDNVKSVTVRGYNVKDFGCTDLTTWYISTSNYLRQAGKDYTTSNTSFGNRASNVLSACLSDNTLTYIDTNGDLYIKGNYLYQGSGSASVLSSFTKEYSFGNTETKFLLAIQPSSNYPTYWFITPQGDLYGMGWNSYGQQGNGTSTDGSVTSFTKRASNVIEVTSNDGRSTFYLTKDGDLYGCGYGSLYQQGNGSTNNVLTFENKMQYLT